jgi:hypothetical protein
VVLGCTRRAASPDAGEVRWLKGQLHVHSSNSADSRTAPEAVARWYAQRGFDFIVFTDHNTVTVTPDVGGMLCIAGIEVTQNLGTCEPPPLPGTSCLLHVSGLFVDPSKPLALAEPPAATREAYYGRAIDAVRAMGGLAQLNHPNFEWGAGLPEVVAAAKRGVKLIEIDNAGVNAANEGDATHPPAETLWRDALDAGVTLYPVAVDDAHHYDDAEEAAAAGEQVFTGDHAWVMVHARKDRASIRAALERGDFYAVKQDGGVITPSPSRR